MAWHRSQPDSRHLEWVARVQHTVLTITPTPWPEPRVELRPEAQKKEANAKGKDGRPSVTTLHCHELAAEYGCDWLGVLVDNTVHVDGSLISSIRVMRWQCWGCTTTFDRTYKKMKSQGFVRSTCNASQSKEDKKRAGQAGGVVASRENKQRAGQVGGVVASRGDKERAGQAGSKENKQRAGQARWNFSSTPHGA